MNSVDVFDVTTVTEDGDEFSGRVLSDLDAAASRTETLSGRINCVEDSNRGNPSNLDATPELHPLDEAFAFLGAVLIVVVGLSSHLFVR